jgi:hypothetical protein
VFTVRPWRPWSERGLGTRQIFFVKHFLCHTRVVLSYRVALCLRLLYKPAHKTVSTQKQTALGARCSQRHEHPVARRSLRLSGQGSAGTVITTIPATTSSLSSKIFGARRSTVTGLTGDSFDEVSNPLPLQLGAESPHTAATSSSTTLSNGALELHGPRDFLLWRDRGVMPRAEPQGPGS